MGHGHRAAGGTRVLIGFVEYAGMQVETRWVGHPHLATGGGSGEQEGMGHSLGQRFDVGRPGERHRQLLRGAEVLAQRQHVGEPLAGMLSRRLHTDDRHAGQLTESAQHGYPSRCARN